MIRLVAAMLLIGLPGSALAAGGFDGAPVWLIYIQLIPVLTLGVACIGLGFFLQAFVRLRTAVLLLAAAGLGLWIWIASSYGLEKTLGASSLFLMVVPGFSLLFGLGWYIGTKQTKRHGARQLERN